MSIPHDAPEGYDAPSHTGETPWGGGPSNLHSTSAAAPGNPSARPPPIPYAAPGASNGSMNPASTVAFMLNMGYPPPPIALEPLRRLVEQMTLGPGQQLSLQSALYITDEISRSPYRISPAVLFVIQQRLHSSKPDRVSLALDLLDMCVKNCGLDFIRHINKEFMKSLTSIVKTASFKDRTLKGQMKKLEKYLTGSPSTTGINTDPRVQKLRKRVLTMIQNWADAFTMHPNQVGPVLDMYRSLVRKGIQFPPRDTSQKYLVKNAESSSAFDSVTNPPPPPEDSIAAVWAGEADFDDPTIRYSSDDLPFSDKQFAQIERLVNLLRSSDETTVVQRALEMCDRLKPILEEAMRELTARINSSSGRKLKSDDPRVTQLNAVFDLDAEVKKRRGIRLLYAGSANNPNQAALKSEVSTSPPAPPPASKPKAANLLDDLLSSDDDGKKGGDVSGTLTSNNGAADLFLSEGVGEEKKMDNGDISTFFVTSGCINDTDPWK